MSTQKSFSYRDAGVDIDAGNALVDRIKPLSQSTMRPGVLGGLGGFGALFEVPLEKYKNPVLVSGTDGVGTKLKLAMQLQQHDTIGIDLVAMCVNDLIVQGAEPLFFLDYYATGKLDIDIAASVVEGIAKGCRLAGCALTGGETAEMPGMYQGSDYDLAGFCVGIVDKADIIDGSAVKPADVLLGLASSGPHSNGYSLIRKLLESSGAKLDSTFSDNKISLRDALLAPTRIYVKSLLQLMRNVDIHALSHITGGGLLENIPRVLPTHCDAQIDRQAWDMPEIFGWLQKQGNIREQEMYRTFNCGIGMVVIVDEKDRATAIDSLSSLGETVYELGQIVDNQNQHPSQVVID